MSGTKCESHAFRTQDWGYESKNTGLHGNSVILSTRSSGQMHISVFFQSFRFFLQSGPLSRPGWPCYDLVRLKQPWKGYQSRRVEGHSCKKEVAWQPRNWMVFGKWVCSIKMWKNVSRGGLSDGRKYFWPCKGFLRQQKRRRTLRHRSI